jgi:hypothetical protein
VHAQIEPDRAHEGENEAHSGTCLGGISAPGRSALAATEGGAEFRTEFAECFVEIRRAVTAPPRISLLAVTWLVPGHKLLPGKMEILKGERV